MTQTARVGEHPAEHLMLEWEPPDGADEHAIATEMVTALFLFAGSWLEPLAMQMRVACYDREIFTEGKTKLESPDHLLVRDPRLPAVWIRPTYRQTVESIVRSITSESVQSWVEQALAQSCGDAERFATSLRELELRASQVSLPRSWIGDDGLAVDCYAGSVRVPVDVRGNTAWVAAPPEPWHLDQPFEVTVTNLDLWLRFAISVYWSPWVGEYARPGSPLADGIARLAARGWSLASD